MLIYSHRMFKSLTFFLTSVNVRWMDFYFFNLSIFNKGLLRVRTMLMLEIQRGAMTRFYHEEYVRDQGVKKQLLFSIKMLQ